MPYITPEARRTVEKTGATGAGELNYLLTKVIHNYLKNKGLKYQTLNDIIGALEGCKLEFFARYVRPYEDIKRKENGDVL